MMLGAGRATSAARLGEGIVQAGEMSTSGGFSDLEANGKPRRRR
jgi:hypothetical protein